MAGGHQTSLLLSKRGTNMEKSYTEEQLDAHILYKLARKRRWGGKPTELIHVRSALPTEHQSQAEEIAKKLADKGLITWLKKTGQIHISLNPHHKKEIIEIVEKYFGKQLW